MILKLFVILTLVFSINSGYGQRDPKPKDIYDAIEIIKSTLEDSIIQNSKQLTEIDFINSCNEWNSEYNRIARSWLYEKERKSKIERHYSKLGVSYSGHIEMIIWYSLYRSLNDIEMSHKQLVQYYCDLENKWLAEDKVRYTTDSLRGFYIPKDLEDCFNQIDLLWSDSSKIKFSKMDPDKIVGKTHFGLGIWMRNNWQLWGGSRLSKYMNDLGIYHPDNITPVIVTLYYQYLTKEDFDLNKEIQLILEDK